MPHSSTKQRILLFSAAIALAFRDTGNVARVGARVRCFGQVPGFLSLFSFFFEIWLELLQLFDQSCQVRNLCTMLSAAAANSGAGSKRYSFPASFA